MPHLRLIKTSEHASLKRLARAAALLVAVPLAACSSGGADRIVATSIQNEDFRARHPIELASSRATLDVIPLCSWRRARRALQEPDQAVRVGIRANRLRRDRSGRCRRADPARPRRARPCPRCAPRSPPAARAATWRLSSYPIADPSVAAPIRLSYATVIARTRTRCGQWPNDLASGSSTEDWENKPYWNFGCANQQMIAAQTADPRDLLSPTATTPPDPHDAFRAASSAVRQGKDPSTNWKVQNTNIGGVGN